MQRTIEFERVAQLLSSGTVSQQQWEAVLQQCISHLSLNPGFSESSLISAGSKIGMEESDFSVLYTSTFLCLRHAITLFKPGQHTRGKTDVQVFASQIEASFQSLNLASQFLSPLLQALSTKSVPSCRLCSDWELYHKYIIALFCCSRTNIARSLFDGVDEVACRGHTVDERDESCAATHCHPGAHTQRWLCADC